MLDIDARAIARIRECRDLEAGWHVAADLARSRELRYATLAVPRASNRDDKSCARLTAGESARPRRRKRASARYTG